MTTEVAAAWVPTGRTLAENETIIAKGIDGFIETGIALADVRETGQYREAGYTSFTEYLLDRWPQLSRAQAYRAIDTAHTALMLSPIGDKPANEAQARELAPLRDNPDAMREVWQGVSAEHGAEATAADVRAAVQDFLAPDSEAEDDEAPTEPVEPELDPGRPQLLQDFRTALEDAPLYGLLCYTPQALLPDVVFYGDADSIRNGLTSIQAWVDEWRQALDS